MYLLISSDWFRSSEKIHIKQKDMGTEVGINVVLKVSRPSCLFVDIFYLGMHMGSSGISSLQVDNKSSNRQITYK